MTVDNPSPDPPQPPQPPSDPYHRCAESIIAMFVANPALAREYVEPVTEIFREAINAAVQNIPCSVCKGTGKAPTPGYACICQGDGKMKSELHYLRAGWKEMRDTLGEVLGRLTEIGHKANQPSHIIGAIEALHQRALDAEDSFVQLRKKNARR